MSYFLPYPYQEKDRLNFIVKYNHNAGLQIIETLAGLYALEENEIMQDETPIINPNYEQEQSEKETKRIAQLSMTKLDFVNAIENFGISYDDLKLILASNKEAQKQWDLCSRVYRFNTLLNSIAEEKGITSQQLDTIFLNVNNEEINNNF